MKKGNWCIAGGDFNKDLLGQSEEIFGGSAEGYTWAQPLPEGIWDGTNLSLVAPLDESNPVPTCRNADAPYHEGQYVLTVGRLRGVGQRHRGAGCGGGHGLCVVGSQSGVHAFVLN